MSRGIALLFAIREDFACGYAPEVRCEAEARLSTFPQLSAVPLVVTLVAVGMWITSPAFSQAGSRRLFVPCIDCVGYRPDLRSASSYAPSFSFD